jgi:hypothetical protein
MLSWAATVDSIAAIAAITDNSECQRKNSSYLAEGLMMGSRPTKISCVYQ